MTDIANYTVRIDPVVGDIDGSVQRSLNKVKTSTFASKGESLGKALSSAINRSTANLTIDLPTDTKAGQVIGSRIASDIESEVSGVDLGLDKQISDAATVARKFATIDFDANIKDAVAESRLLEASTNRVRDAARRAGLSQAEVEDAVRRSTVETKRLAKELSNAATDGKDFRSSMDEATRAILRAEDGADRLGDELGRLKIPDALARNVRSLDSNLGKAGVSSKKTFDTGKLGGFSKSLGGAAIGMASFAAAAALAARASQALFAGFKTSISLSSDLNESLGLANQVFGNSADQFVRFSENASEALGVSQATALQQGSVLGQILQNLDFTEAASVSTSESILQLSADIGSAFNRETPEVIEAITAAINGENEQMKRLGVNISAAAVEQEALRLGLAATKGEIDRNAKAVATLSLIEQQTANIAGDFARTQGDLATNFKQLQAQVADAGAEFGTAFLPVLSQTVTLIADDIVPAFITFGETAGPVLAGIIQFTADYTTILIDAVSQTKDFIDSVGGIGSVVSDLAGVDLGLLGDGFGLIAGNASESADEIRKAKQESKEFETALLDSVSTLEAGNTGQFFHLINSEAGEVNNAVDLLRENLLGLFELEPTELSDVTPTSVNDRRGERQAYDELIALQEAYVTTLHDESATQAQLAASSKAVIDSKVDLGLAIGEEETALFLAVAANEEYFKGTIKNIAASNEQIEADENAAAALLEKAAARAAYVAVPGNIVGTLEGEAAAITTTAQAQAILTLAWEDGAVSEEELRSVIDLTGVSEAELTDLSREHAKAVRETAAANYAAVGALNDLGRNAQETVTAQDLLTLAWADGEASAADYEAIVAQTGLTMVDLVPLASAAQDAFGDTSRILAAEVLHIQGTLRGLDGALDTVTFSLDPDNADESIDEFFQARSDAITKASQRSIVLAQAESLGLTNALAGFVDNPELLDAIGSNDIAGLQALDASFAAELGNTVTAIDAGYASYRASIEQLTQGTLEGGVNALSEEEFAGTAFNQAASDAAIANNEAVLESNVALVESSAEQFAIPNAASEAASSFSTSVTEAFDGNLDFQTGIDAEFEALISSFSSIGGLSVSLSSITFAEKLSTNFGDALDFDGEANRALADITFSTGSTLVSAILSGNSIGLNLGLGIANGLVSSQAAVLDSVSKVTGAINTRIRSDLEIRSPSRVAQEIGDLYGQGLAKGLTGAVSSVSGAAGNLASAAVAAPQGSGFISNNRPAAAGNNNNSSSSVNNSRSVDNRTSNQVTVTLALPADGTTDPGLLASQIQSRLSRLSL